MKSPNLSEAFGFTAEELALNREGNVSPDQLAALRSSSLGMTGFFAVLLVAVVWGTIRPSHPSVRIFAPIVGFVLLVVASSVVLPAWRDLLRPTVVAREGPVFSLQSVGKGPGQAVLVLEDARVLTSAAWVTAQDVIEVGHRRYRIYLLQHTQRLLSLEVAQD